MNKIKTCIPHGWTSYHTKIWLQVNVWMSVTVDQNMSETMRSFKRLGEWRNVLGLKNKNMEIMSILKSSYRRRKRIASHNHIRKALSSRCRGGIWVKSFGKQTATIVGSKRHYKYSGSWSEFLSRHLYKRIWSKIRSSGRPLDDLWSLLNC